MSLQICGLNRSNTRKELQPHGTAEFPCAAYASHHSDAPADVIPWHWHEELEAVYIIGGTLKLQIPGGEFLLHQGDLVILNVNVLHSAIGHPTGALHSIVFSPFLIAGGADTVFSPKIHQWAACLPGIYGLASRYGHRHPVVFGCLFRSGSRCFCV